MREIGTEKFRNTNSNIGQKYLHTIQFCKIYRIWKNHHECVIPSRLLKILHFQEKQKNYIYRYISDSLFFELHICPSFSCTHLLFHALLLSIVYATKHDFLNNRFLGNAASEVTQADATICRTKHAEKSQM